jgi:predicted RNA-binding protein
MCLAKAFLEKDGERELILESVALMEIEGKTLRLSSLFGEEKEIEATIRQVDFENSRIILQKAA